MSASGAPVPYGEDEPRGSLALSSREAVHKSLPPVPPGMMAFGGGSGDGSGPIPGLPPKHARAPSGTLNELRYPSGYLPGLNGQHHPPGMDPRQSLSGSRPAGYSNAGTTSHSPSGSFQMTDSGRASMQAARPNGAMLQAQGHGHPFPPQQNQNQGSGGGRQPTRPPRNPKRPDGAPGSPSGPSSASSHRQMQMQQQQAQQQQQRQQQSWNPRDDLPPRAVSSMGQNDARDKPRKSKLLKLPFGRKKRDSTAGDERPAGTKPGASGLGLGLPPLRNRKSFGALDDLVESGPGGGGGRQPKNSFHVERQRVLSAPNDMRNHPPRAQSAMGRLPTQNFVHMPGMPMPGIEDSDDEDDFAAAAGRPFGSGPGPSFLSGPGANAVLAKGPRRQASGASMKSPSDKEKDKDKTAGARRGSGSWKRASGPLSIPIPLPGARRSSSTKSKKKLQQAQQPMHAQQQQRHGSILQEESFVAIRYPSGSPN